MSTVEVKELKNEVKSLDNKVSGLDKKLDKVLLYLYNDDQSGRTGIIQSLQEVKADVDGILVRERLKNEKIKQETFFKKKIVAIYVTIGLFILEVLKWLAKLLFPFLGKII